ncbi:aminodeoxychorismate/anthranilate synthase component II [Filobacillus milosensis]|uniref:Aminodeoxychorismate/anthranilate synthase component II n=1 Tax=Filobacillus milosensis TaxID=94137 RepID=A0A4Y8IKZ6_9BACI|nr:aminodeoxychorismate/anthranilate synthase component II [Filobacillus milosensis]TFB21824.1 aminodeoxychorismate/anthranilate synthase component II [Filobacillus milosensis]
MILLIDNYDSFTYNLFQYLEELGSEVLVKRNDEITLDEINLLEPEAIIISPGPGRPEHAGESVSIIQEFHDTIPILGICLGHQAIGSAFGAEVKRARTVRHGKRSLIKHKGTGLFQYLPQPLEVMRYHSLVIDSLTLPPSFKKLAMAMDDQELMAIKHYKYPVYGLQFHPESIGTADGKRILNNFLLTIRKENDHESFIKKVN